jgi:protein TonB
MFETAVLANQNDTKRVWSTCAGMTAQTLLVLGAFLAPAIWPDVLPHAQLLVSLVAPSAQTRPDPAPPARQETRPAPVKPFQIHEGGIVIPTQIPPHPVAIEDPPDVIARPCLNCVIGANPIGAASTLIGDYRPGPPPMIRTAEHVVPAEVAPPTQRLRLGGNVRLAQPIHRVEPIYPRVAIIARVSGPVDLEGVIGTDGRIHELRALRGNPLLVPAALEAVRQWVYEPTLLNGSPVEVVAPITVNFRLTQ